MDIYRYTYYYHVKHSYDPICECPAPPEGLCASSDPVWPGFDPTVRFLPLLVFKFWSCALFLYSISLHPFHAGPCLLSPVLGNPSAHAHAHAHGPVDILPDPSAPRALSL